jgi:hypothetical protein
VFNTLKKEGLAFGLPVTLMVGQAMAACWVP